MTTVVSVAREPVPITGKTSRTRKVHGNPVPPLLTPSLKMTIFKSLSWSTPTQDCRAENTASFSEDEDIWKLFFFKVMEIGIGMSCQEIYVPRKHHCQPRPCHLLSDYPDWGRGWGSKEPPLLAELTLESEESIV